MIKKLLGSFVLTLHTAVAFGQNKPAPANEGWQTVFFESPAMALPLLMNAAIQHSAALKAMEIEKSIGQQEVKIAKKSILSGVALGAGYTYGNLTSIALADPGNPNQFATYSSGRYSTGVTVSLPIDRIVTQGNLVKKQVLSVDRTEAMRQEQENQLRQRIISLYQNVLLARKVLNLRQESYVTVQTTYRLAEKQFRQGQMTLTELSSANAQLNDMSVAQETARNQYDTAFLLLEEVVGAQISTLMTAK
ncbi:TolC family protein [Hymenobacter negativus]|uniref:TolC family protein n=1 Tax=Hymenobacter negativus TaxID=2795026 RepID=A0ABS3QBB4_9BACT|nr:TolC family protein [Hymenobacter negativus]MBO2008258.1 TolC family protein [Hymenobacter negativus]